jgi:phytoene synthase
VTADELGRRSIERGKRDLERGSRTFALASRLLDREARRSAYQLYAWGRYCDDVVDGQVLGHGQHRPAGGTEQARSRLTELRTRTEAALAGRPDDDPIYVGLAQAIRRHAIPPALPLELLEGLGWDVEGVRCPTEAETRRYAELVAGSVAAMMGAIMGAKTPPTITAFERLGTAVQFTNIARDVVDDAAAGRIYLPLDQLAAAGIAPDAVGRPEHRAALVPITNRLLDQAEQLYAEGLAGITPLSFRYRAVVHTGALAYREIGRRIRSQAARAWDRRMIVGPGRRMVLLIEGIVRAALGSAPRQPGTS